MSAGWRSEGSEAPRPIETRYKGYRFRSRLEARWAVFFDAMGVEWEYEPEGYDLGEAGWYLPDFLLPELQAFYGPGFYVEIKGRDLTEEERFKLGMLVDQTGRPGLALCGSPWPGDCKVTEFMRRLRDGKLEKLMRQAIEDDARQAFSRLISGEYVAPILVEAKEQRGWDYTALATNKGTPWDEPFWTREAELQACRKCKALMLGSPMDFCRHCEVCGGVTSEFELVGFCNACGESFQRQHDVPRIMNAYNAARGARFEHGEQG